MAVGGENIVIFSEEVIDPSEKLIGIVATFGRDPD
jgi:hypothetical protein